MSEKNHDTENNIGVSAKHGTWSHSRISNGRRQRNSSIELLRIIAMFMILAHHFIIHNGYDVKQLPSDRNESSSSSSCRAAARSVSSSSSPSPHGSSSTRNRPSKTTSSACGSWNANSCSGASRSWRSTSFSTVPTSVRRP